MFWFIYILTSALFCYFLLKRNKNFLLLFPILLTFFITPTLLQTGQSELAPALFVFIFDLVFEKKVSLNPLRPLVLSLPLVFFLVFTLVILKKRFF
tara:strand:- start:179 stop:466 length:288 start_codon:yes stop_codon:yes gene_type:complete